MTLGSRCRYNPQPYGYGKQPQSTDEVVVSDGVLSDKECRNGIAYQVEGGIKRLQGYRKEVQMIGKIKKGKSFGGCIRYVMGRDYAEIIASAGVLLGTNKEMINSFNG